MLFAAGFAQGTAAAYGKMCIDSPTHCTGFAVCATQLFEATSAGDGAQQQAASLSTQLENVQAALEAAETDRQALAAQRDGWMASFQEAYGGLSQA